MSVHKIHAESARQLIDDASFSFTYRDKNEGLFTIMHANTLATLALYELVKESVTVKFSHITPPVEPDEK